MAFFFSCMRGGGAEGTASLSTVSGTIPRMYQCSISMCRPFSGNFAVTSRFSLRAAALMAKPLLAVSVSHNINAILDPATLPPGLPPWGWPHGFRMLCFTIILACLRVYVVSCVHSNLLCSTKRNCDGWSLTRTVCGFEFCLCVNIALRRQAPQ